MGAKRLDGCDVLLVEDEPLVMLDIKCSLEDVGAHVYCARRVSEAMEVVNTTKISAAVLDYVLTDGTADELCSELKTRNIPFAIYSGYRNVEGSCSRGDVLPKPSCSDDLVRKVVGLFEENGLAGRY